MQTILDMFYLLPYPLERRNPFQIEHLILVPLILPTPLLRLVHGMRCENNGLEASFKSQHQGTPSSARISVGVTRRGNRPGKCKEQYQHENDSNDTQHSELLFS